MRKFLFLMIMGVLLTPSFADGGKRKKKQKSETVVEMQTTPVIPVNRERWIEREGQHYVIVTRTTSTSEDFHRIRRVNKNN